MTTCAAPVLAPGDFVLVRKDHEEFWRAGKDAQVVQVDGDDVVVLFGADRSGKDQHVVCVGLEAWTVAELDLSSVDRAPRRGCAA